MIPTNELQRRIASSVASVDNDKATALTSAILGLPRRAATRKELAQSHPDLLRSAALICDAGTGLSDYSFRHVHDLQKERAMEGRLAQVVFWLILLAASVLASPVAYVLALLGSVQWSTFGIVLGTGSVLFVVSGLAAFRSNYPPRRAVIQSPPEISRNIWQAAADVHVTAALRAAGETGALLDQLEEPWLRAGLTLPSAA
ncbi:MAG TPA: hypothetical protein VF885_06920 [Arthrobacter sp.]